MRIVLVLVLLTIITLSAYSQGTLTGKITEKGSGNPLQNVSVYLEGTTLGAATDVNGSYTISNIPAGSYQVAARLLGYDLKRTGFTVEGDTETTLDFVLTENFVEISGVVIRGTTLTGGASGVNSVPGSAQYLSRKDLEKFSYNDVNRVLRNIPGINIQEEDGFGLRPNIGMRGTGVERSSKITLMEDGILIAPAPYAAPAAYYFPTVGRMQGVEVRKGSSQIKYGPYTTGGAINFISTQIPGTTEANFSILGGNFGQRIVHANAGTSFKNGGLVLETYQAGADGFKELDNGGETGFDSQDYLAKIRINTNADAKIYQSLQLKIGQTIGESDETYLGITQEDFEITPFRRYAGSQVDLMETRHNQISLQHVIRPSRFIDITTTAYRTEFKRNWYKLDAVRYGSQDGSSVVGIADLLEAPSLYGSAFGTVTGSGPDTLLVKANNRAYYAKGVQSIAGIQFQTADWSHEIEVGIRVHKDEMDRYQWVDDYIMDEGIMELINSGQPGTESNRIESANAFASFIQYTLKGRRLSLVPGLRYESISIRREDYGKQDPERTGQDLRISENSVNVWIPGIGIEYTANSYLDIFTGVHKGFSPPGSRDGTEAEESVNYEIGARLNRGALLINGVLFINDYKNLLGSDLSAAGGAGTPDLFNGGQALIRGAEVEITYDLLNSHNQFSMPLQVVYTHTYGEFQNSFESDFEPWGTVESGDQLPYLAPHQLAVNVSLEAQKFNFNVSSKYVSDMRTVAGDGEIPTNQMIPSQLIIDLSGTYFLNKNISFFANLRNITDEVYLVARRPAGLRPGLPRSFVLGLKANF